jgi:hypothetical protein
VSQLRQCAYEDKCTGYRWYHQGCVQIIDEVGTWLCIECFCDAAGRHQQTLQALRNSAQHGSQHRGSDARSIPLDCPLLLAVSCADGSHIPPAWSNRPLFVEATILSRLPDRMYTLSVPLFDHISVLRSQRYIHRHCRYILPEHGLIISQAATRQLRQSVSLVLPDEDESDGASSGILGCHFSDQCQVGESITDCTSVRYQFDSANRPVVLISIS